MMLGSDWSGIIILGSDWSVCVIQCPDWSVSVIQRSDWSGIIKLGSDWLSPVQDVGHEGVAGVVAPQEAQHELQTPRGQSGLPAPLTGLERVMMTVIKIMMMMMIMTWRPAWPRARNWPSIQPSMTGP